MIRSINKILKTVPRLLLILNNRGYTANSAKKLNLWTPNRTVISPYENVEIPKLNIADYVLQSLEKWPEKTAVVCGITNRSYTYRQLYKYTRNFAAQLRLKFKIRDGAELIIMMPNSIDYPVAVLGAVQAGCEVITVNPCYTAHEFRTVVLSSNPKTIMGTTETYKTIETVLREVKRDIPVIIVEDIHSIRLKPGAISYRELIEDTNIDHSVLKEVNRTVDDVAFLPFSSGTTGVPKQVEITNTNITLICINQDIEEIKTYRDTTSTYQDSVLAVLPFFHIFGLALLLHKISIAAKLVILPNFHPATFLTSLKEHKISVLYAVPPLVSFLGSNPTVTKEHLKPVQNLVWGAAPLSKTELNNCQEKCNPNLKVTELYGSTETSLVTVSVPGVKNSGYAVRNIEMRIINDKQNNLGPNEIGELLVRGPQVISRYRNDPDATKAAFAEGDWFKTGDLASINLDGSLNVIDRVKEIIKVKGYQVAPVEIENVLKEHPAVLEAVVIGKADAKTGEAPKAFVVFKQGHQASEENIKQFVEKRVAEYKRLKEVVVLNEIPKNPAGKILRKDLKANYC